MITLKTLPDATAQEVFDQVANHLLTQNKESIKDLQCQYHYNELKCAAGCLIAEDEYDPKMDLRNHSWIGLINKFGITDKHHQLITRLQFIHDKYSPNNWKTELIELAEKKGLNYDKL
jgi:hypothetical protein